MRTFCRSLLLSLLLAATVAGWDPFAVYALLQSHPDQQMAIQWVTPESRTKSTLIFAEEGDGQWYKVDGTHSALPLAPTLNVHRIVLTGLKPETTYQFKIKKGGQTYRFKTLPKGLSRPVTFAEGGDIYHDGIEYVRKMNRLVASKSPDFVLLGGDIAYAHSRLSILPESVVMWTQEVLSKIHLSITKRNRWLDWLQAWSEDMVTSDGRLIPLAATIGNHDLNGGYNETKESAKIFYLLFMGDAPTIYREIDFEKDMTIISLDSGHSAPIGGEQSAWLFQTLKERKDYPRKFAFYHVPSYPSARDVNLKYAVAIRRHWLPIFDTFGLDAAFEHHDHTYKRTVPIKNGKEDPKGIVYLGDGSWGIKSPRRPKKDRWYLARAEQTRNVIFVTVSKEEVKITVYDDNGKVIDTYNKN
jgi:3',5'-cyclic AMP phosphodiesterase CpdA